MERSSAAALIECWNSCLVQSAVLMGAEQEEAKGLQFKESLKLERKREQLKRELNWNVGFSQTKIYLKKYKKNIVWVGFCKDI